MDDSAAQTLVEWREWGPEAFAEAADEGRPLLLSLSAPWCTHCHEMDRTTYSEPRIAANIGDAFVPVRVNVDRHPRVRDRYNMGGFPSTVFCTPEGEVITGAGFLSEDSIRQILTRVRETWDQKGDAAGSVPRQLQDDAPPAGEVSARIEEHMVEQLLAAFDEEFGGWGTDVKFPLPRTVEFALVRARDQATRTLEAVRTHLLDTYDGGFYRYATQRDWGNPSREKLLDENAAILRAFARAYRYTGEDAYRDAAERGVEYLTTNLWTGEAFGASQAGDDEYYRLGPTEREDAEAPHVDETILADRNAVAIDALLTFYAYTDDETARRYAERARSYLLDELVEAGAVTHYRTEGEAGETALLSDQSRVLQALTTSGQVLGELGPAEAVADHTVTALRTDSGAFRDGPLAGAGLLDEPLYAFDGNAEMADALLDLAALTGEERYADLAEDAVAAFAGAAERMGVEVANYAAVAARCRDPRRVEVAAPAGSDLHRAALRLADHESVVVPDSDGPEAGTAHLVEDGTAGEAADSPAALETVLTGE
jgi:uncharacterized protein YyaL (SSP411 family)